MKKILRIFAILFHIILFAALALFVLYSRFRPISYTPAAFTETNALLDNPFCGFFHLNGYLLSEDPPENMALRCRQDIYSNRRHLMMAQINLKNYAHSDISETALQQLDSILSEISLSKKQVILRFLYDWDGKALETEPAELSQVVRHMDQVAAIVNQYADSVLVIQSTFTGNCGEMTQTRFGSHEHNRYLMTHLSQVIDPAIFLAVRTPSHLRGVTQSKSPIGEENAFDGTLSSRLGLFNDGMLGSVYDLGTYDDTSFADSAVPEEKGTREEEIAFQEYLCQYVPNGGEAVLDNPYNDFENAVIDLRRMHVSYLNRDHDAEVLEKWKAATYEGDGCFQGMNGLDYIEAHLGYRFTITKTELSYDAMKSDCASLTITIQNTGFAPSYRNFDAKISLLASSSGVLISLPAQMDVRTIKAGQEASFTFPLAVRSLPEDSYEMSFGLTDPYTGQPIQFANAATKQNGQVPLGTLTLPATSKGAAYGIFLETLLAYFDLDS